MKREIWSQTCVGDHHRTEGRDRGDASVNQATLRNLPSKPQAKGGVDQILLYSPPEGNEPTDALNVDFWPSGLCDDKRLLYVLPSL